MWPSQKQQERDAGSSRRWASGRRLTRRSGHSWGIGVYELEHGHFSIHRPGWGPDSTFSRNTLDSALRFLERDIAASTGGNFLEEGARKDASSTVVHARLPADDARHATLVNGASERLGVTAVEEDQLQLTALRGEARRGYTKADGI